MLRKNLGFTAIAIVTLGLGIGVNTCIFSFVSAILLRKPPVKDPERLMMLRSTSPKGVWMPDMAPVSAPDFLDWRRQANSFSGIAGAAFGSFTLSGSIEPQRVSGAQVSANYFQVLGVAPARGRNFEPDEDQPGRTKVAMLSEDLWRQLFGGDTGVIGRTLKVDGEECTVIGIVPSRFRMWLFPGAGVWIPAVFKPEQLGPKGRKDRFLEVFARLKPNVNQTQAQAELATIAERLARNYPESDKGWSAKVVQLQENMVEISNTRAALTLLMAAVSFVLLIACANLANLLLARNTTRRREFAIRAALGAGRLRLARQLISECLLLSLAGGGLGVMLSVWGLGVLRAQFNWNEYALAMGREIFIDRSVLLFTLVVSVLAAMLFGLAPALRLSRSGPAVNLKESSRTTSSGREHRRLQNLLVVAEITLSLILLVGAGLIVESFIEELRAAPGFDPHNVLTASISLSGEAYKDPARQAAFMQNVLHQLESMPDVQSAGAATDLPFEFPTYAPFTIEARPAARPNERPTAGHFLISPGDFGAARIPLLEGREFTSSDNAGAAPVAIVNEAFARKYFENANSVGRHIQIDEGGESAKWSEIVGVVRNINEFSGQAAPTAHIFEPLLAHPSADMKLLVRTRGDPANFSPALRRAVSGVDKGQAVSNLRTMDRLIRDSEQGDDLMAELMGTFAAIALIMAAVGIYGLLAYLVGERTQEFGVRMALGAGRAEIVRLVIRSAAGLVATGTGIGFLISLALPRLFVAAFTSFHVNSRPILIGAPAVVMLVALAACYIPARRATKVDPMVALRYE